MRKEVLATVVIVVVVLAVGAVDVASSPPLGSTSPSRYSVYQEVRGNITLNGQPAQEPCIGFNLADCSSSGGIALRNVELIKYGDAYYYLYSVAEPNGQPQNDSLPLPTTTYTVWFTNSSVYCVSPAHPLRNTEHQNPTCPDIPYEATSIVVPTTQDATSNFALGLRLDLSVTANSSGGISIKVDESNLLNRTNVVSAASHWPLSASDMFLWLQDGCGPPPSIPIGYSIVQGNYSLSDFGQGTPLWLEASPLIPGCPYEAPTSEYNFQPMSEVATWSGSYTSFDMPVVTPCQFNPASGCYWFGTGTYLGYWIGSTVQAGGGQSGVVGGACPGASTTGFQAAFSCPLEFYRFPAGVYTVIAADEWGQVTLLHFVVQEA